MRNGDDKEGPIKSLPNQEPAEIDNSTTSKSSTGTALGKTFAIFLIVAGLVIGFFIGMMINFGGCYKQSCSPIEENAALILPLASLLITLPVAFLAFRKK